MKTIRTLAKAFLVLVGLAAASSANAQQVNVISGQVYNPWQYYPFQGIVTIYQLGSNYSNTVLTDSMGGYSFTGIPNGTYVVQGDAAPGTTFYTSVVPTYSVSELTWATSARVTVSPNTTQGRANISLIAARIDSGDGGIWGPIRWDSIFNTNARVAYTTPFEPTKALVIARNTVTGLVYTSRIVGGQFNLRNLPYGTYSVSLEHPRLTSTAQTIVISATAPISSINYNVTAAGTVSATITGLAGNQAFNKAVRLYPNPSRSILNVEAAGRTLQGAKVLNALGQEVRVNISLNEDKAQLNVESLTPGMYTLMLQASNGETSRQTFLKD